MQGNQFKQQGYLLLNLLIVFVSATLSNLAAVESLSERWLKLNENLGHGFPLLALTAYFLFNTKDKLQFRKGLPINGMWLVSLLIMTSLVMKHFDILVVQQLIVWLMICLGYFFLFTPSSVIPSLFPLGLFVFVIPVWDQLVPALAGVTAIVVEFALQFSGIVAYIDGRHIELPFGVITVADACSGVRYVTIGLALSYLSAFTLPINFRQRVNVILVGLLLSIFANWLRVFIIVLVGYHSEMQSELVADHELFGFILFFVLIAPILFYRGTKEVPKDVVGTFLQDKVVAIFSKETHPFTQNQKLLLLLSIGVLSGVLMQL